MAYSILYQLSYNQLIYTFTNFTKLGFPCYKLLYTHMAGSQSNICHRRFLFRLYLLRLCHNIYASTFVWHIPYSISNLISVLCIYLLILPNMGFPCCTLLYTHMAGLQSSICHWRSLFRPYILRVPPFPYVHFCTAYSILHQLSYNCLCTYLIILLILPNIGFPCSILLYMPMAGL